MKNITVYENKELEVYGRPMSVIGMQEQSIISSAL